MDGFLNTWLHNLVGLSLLGLVFCFGYVVYDTGRIHGKIDAENGYYAEGYRDGYQKGLGEGEMEAYNWYIKQMKRGN